MLIHLPRMVRQIAQRERQHHNDQHPDDAATCAQHIVGRMGDLRCALGAVALMEARLRSPCGDDRFVRVH